MKSLFVSGGNSVIQTQGIKRPCWGAINSFIHDKKGYVECTTSSNQSHKLNLYEIVGF